MTGYNELSNDKYKLSKQQVEWTLNSKIFYVEQQITLKIIKCL